MSRNRSEWLDAVLQYFLLKGAASASLRPIAAALGTSARILLFHFRSKEGLLQAVMQELEERLRERLKLLSVAPVRRSRAAPLQRFWDWAIEDENLPYLRLLYEMQIIAIQSPKTYGAYLSKASSRWRDDVLMLMSKPLKSSTSATLCIAVFDGLILELIATGDKRRLTAALDRFVLLMRESGSD